MTDERKLTCLSELAAADALDPGLQRVAIELWRASLRRPAVFTRLVHAATRAIAYRTDTARTGGEDIGGLTRPAEVGEATRAYRAGEDDCDAMARWFVALHLAVGLRARIAPLWRGDELAHVFAEVMIGDQWRPVELTCERAVIGEHPLAVPVERDGRRLENRGARL